MNDFLEMHVFFVVTTIVIAVLGALIGVLLWRAHRIFKKIEHIAEIAAMESEFIRQDIHDLRRDLQKGKGRIKSMVGFITKITARHAKKRTP